METLTKDQEEELTEIEEWKEMNRQLGDYIEKNNIPMYGGKDDTILCQSEVSPHRGTNEWSVIRFKERNPFGSSEYPRTNVWNHEWTSQFKSYQREHKGEKPEEVIQNEEWMMEELVPLFKKENPNWKTCEETQDRLLELIGECRKNETEY